MLPLYYEYGSASLLQAEQSANVFGDAVQSPQQTGEANADASGGRPAAAPPPPPPEAAPAAYAAPLAPVEEPEGGSGGAALPDSLMQELCEMYEKENGKAPTMEVLKKWKEQLSEANLDFGDVRDEGECEGLLQG